MATPKYIVLIDAGSTGSRLSIFESTNLGMGQRLGINKIFPLQGDEKSRYNIDGCGGGIHCARVERVGEDVQAHLRPILNAAVAHLDTLQGATRANTYIYLLATGGMRNLWRSNATNYGVVLDCVRQFIQTYHAHFAFNPTNIRTIPGQQEGWFAWTILNYGRLDHQYNPMAVLEMGGASLQYAYTVEDGSTDDHAHFICTNKGGRIRREKVYARSWDALGADAFNNFMVNELREEQDNRIPNNRIRLRNPCLPTGQLTVPSQNGTGNFAECRARATRIYTDSEVPALDSPGLISPATDRFMALSNYYFTYDFFTNRGTGYNRGRPYDPARFKTVVEEYCENPWDANGWAHNISITYTQRHCLIAAALLHSLGDAPNDDMLKVIINKEIPWTWGAAALIANHGGLKLCPNDAELPDFPVQEPLVGDGNLNVSLAQIPPTFTQPAFVQPALIVTTPSVPLWAYLSFAAALVFIGRLLVQRYRAKALGKISLPDMESASGVKGDMKDLGGTVQGLEGFYKD